MSTAFQSQAARQGPGRQPRCLSHGAVARRWQNRGDLRQCSCSANIHPTGGTESTVPCIKARNPRWPHRVSNRRYDAANALLRSHWHLWSCAMKNRGCLHSISTSPYAVHRHWSLCSTCVCKVPGLQRTGPRCRSPSSSIVLRILTRPLESFCRGDGSGCKERARILTVPRSIFLNLPSSHETCSSQNITNRGPTEHHVEPLLVWQT